MEMQQWFAKHFTQIFPNRGSFYKEKRRNNQGTNLVNLSLSQMKLNNVSSGGHNNLENFQSSRLVHKSFVMAIVQLYIFFVYDH